MAMDIKQELSRQLTKINVKTSAFMEENRLKTYISTLEGEIANLKLQSGELGYNLWKDDRFDVEKLIPLYKEITGKYQQIQEQEKQIKALGEQNRQILGEPSGAGAGGGAPGAPSGNVCPQCGEVCAPNVNFCKRCGTKLR